MDVSSINRRPISTPVNHCLLAVLSLLSMACAGCYAPLHSPGIEARELPERFRWPTRTAANPLNFSHLVRPTPSSYILGTGDKLTLIAPDLIQEGRSEPIEVEVLENGAINVPRLGPVEVGGMTLSQAHETVNEALSGGVLVDPQTVLTLTEKGTVSVLVLGAVQNPGVHELPRYQNDVAHALAAAQGFSEEAGEYIEIHRRNAPLGTYEVQEISPTPMESLPVVPAPPLTLSGHDFHQTSNSSNKVRVLQVSATHQPGVPQETSADGGLTGIPATFESVPPFPSAQFNRVQENVPEASPYTSPFCPPMPAPPAIPNPVMDEGCYCSGSPIVRIPLRGDNESIDPNDVILQAGDVVVIPQKTDKVFYVVGPLSEQNRVRFTVGDRDRSIGNGLLLPHDREIDVVTAVAMAGYIDPINSPTTVTLHRVKPGQKPLLIRVDLIAARSDPRETVLVQADDIIYLNPDPWWYSRRLADRIVERALGTAIGRWLTN